jgi:hypothetical protein
LSDQPHTAKQLNKTPDALEKQILERRRYLRDESPLGEYGPAALRRVLLENDSHAPSLSTIKRVLLRRGALDGKRRIRRKAPPSGWHLPDVRDKRAELDSFDLIEDLKIENGPLVDVLNSVALHGKRIRSWAREGAFTSEKARISLIEHWREHGLPTYAQFDNSPIFTGGAGHPDILGSVIRLCLALGVTPVFAPIREHGLQNAIEGTNARYQAKVWRRFHHDSLAALKARALAYEAAANNKNAASIGEAPARTPFPGNLRCLTLPARPKGIVIYIRRTTGQGNVEVLGRTYQVSKLWTHRLVRCEVDLDRSNIRFYGLRRAAPDVQPLLRQVPYSMAPKDKIIINLRPPR